MKKNILTFVIILLVIIAIAALFIISKNNTKTYGCDEIKKQIDLCWEKGQQNPNVNADCWQAPANYTDVCKNLTGVAHLSLYDPCDGLMIFYFPPINIPGLEQNASVEAYCPAVGL